MLIVCPECQSRYRIDPTKTSSRVAKVKCPDCSHLFEVSLVSDSTGHVATAVTEKPVVLVVDDARFFREMIRDILKELPIDLVMCADGNEAWQKINASLPSLVLLDLNIPEKSGRDILLALQSSPLQGRIKVLVMSAVERGEEISREVCQIGAIDFISKSFRPQELQNRVRSILEL